MNPKSFEELATEQNVKPANWDKLTKDWPEGADFDTFFNAVRGKPLEDRDKRLDWDIGSEERA